MPLLVGDTVGVTVGVVVGLIPSVGEEDSLELTTQYTIPAIRRMTIKMTTFEIPIRSSGMFCSIIIS